MPVVKAALLFRLAPKDFVVAVRVERRIEIDEINARIGKFARIAQPFQIVAKIKTIHSSVSASAEGWRAWEVEIQPTDKRARTQFIAKSSQPNVCSSSPVEVVAQFESEGIGVALCLLKCVKV
jgi:hypothetical protein